VVRIWLVRGQRLVGQPVDAGVVAAALDAHQAHAPADDDGAASGACVKAWITPEYSLYSVDAEENAAADVKGDKGGEGVRQAYHGSVGEMAEAVEAKTAQGGAAASDRSHGGIANAQTATEVYGAETGAATGKHAYPKVGDAAAPPEVDFLQVAGNAQSNTKLSAGVQKGSRVAAGVLRRKQITDFEGSILAVDGESH